MFYAQSGGGRGAERGRGGREGEGSGGGWRERGGGGGERGRLRGLKVKNLTSGNVDSYFASTLMLGPPRRP